MLIHPRKALYGAAALLGLMLPVVAAAQSSSINSFSPYTLHGLGDLTNQGAAYMRSMGGAGVAYNDPTKINFLNPAASAWGMQRSFLLNFGIEGQNYYLSDGQRKSSYNSFSIRDVAIQLPITSRIGFGVSVTPYSSVGYRIQKDETDPSIIDQLKRVTYLYEGSGDITQLKAGLGYAPSKRFSVGAEMVYYLGNIKRDFTASILTYTGEVENPIVGVEKDNISRFSVNFGAQYHAILTQKRVLTFGATYQPETKLNPKVSRYISSGGYFDSSYGFQTDTVFFSSRMSDMRMPQTFTLGAFYNTPKLGIGLDYTYQGWGANSTSDLSNAIVNYRNTNSFKAGFQYTPNRIDVRRFMNRVTYRAGVRYSDYYMMINGHNINEKAITVGFGIPLKMAGASAVNIGLEAATRGSKRNGLIRENVFKISVGLSLFGEDDWFIKPKYD